MALRKKVTPVTPHKTLKITAVATIASLSLKKSWFHDIHQIPTFKHYKKIHGKEKNMLLVEAPAQIPESCQSLLSNEGYF
jgi:hypothetical protein